MKRGLIYISLVIDGLWNLATLIIFLSEMMHDMGKSEASIFADHTYWGMKYGLLLMLMVNGMVAWSWGKLKLDELNAEGMEKERNRLNSLL